jgi:hypothetical protein
VKRRSRPVDLLPLLDVMMTVTFTFATVQEVEVDSKIAAAAGAAASAVAAATSAAATANEKAESAATLVTDAQKAVAALKYERDALKDDRTRAETERAATAEKLKVTERRVELLVRDGEAMREKMQATPEGERVDSVLAHLLKRNTVVEIELAGVPTEPFGVPDNHCCYRLDPRTSAWRSCGNMPPQSTGLEDWARADGYDLLQALEETKGGSAIAVVRQAGSATYKSGEKLERYIRSRVQDRTVYLEERGLDMGPRPCDRSRPR